jgi:uncharacterized protein (DUF488 family)
MDPTPAHVVTIGYGSRSLEDFLGLLVRYDIRIVVDIRSRPYSRHQPEFSREAVKLALARTGVRYAFMGDALGGRPDDPTCYIDGKVDYGICRERQVYRDAVARLARAAHKEPVIGLMCAELKPHECHRAKLVGASLSERGVAVSHIDEKGHLRTQADILMLAAGGQESLFGPSFLTSRRRYAPRSTKGWPS